MCALEELRHGLRRRDVYVTPSERFADARSSLLSDAAWDASREDTCRALSLPLEADAFIEQLAEDLDDAYQRTRDGLTADHAIHALAARGELPVDRLDAPSRRRRRPPARHRRMRVGARGAADQWL